jgi:hypothetical protein
MCWCLPSFVVNTRSCKLSGTEKRCSFVLALTDCRQRSSAWPSPSDFCRPGSIRRELGLDPGRARVANANKAVVACGAAIDKLADGGRMTIAE